MSHVFTHNTDQRQRAPCFDFPVVYNNLRKCLENAQFIKKHFRGSLGITLMLLAAMRAKVCDNLESYLARNSFDIGEGSNFTFCPWIFLEFLI